MKKTIHNIPWALLLLTVVALTVVSCRKDKDKERLTSIGGVIEDTPVEDGSKVYLSDNEQWLRWENGDKIFVWSTTGESGTYELASWCHQQLIGSFLSSSSEVTANSTLYAFYPLGIASNPANLTSGSHTMTLMLPATHPYRENSSAIDPDFSFGKGAMPMVAYRPEHNSQELYFHSLAGILRFQLYGGSLLTDEFTINEITFEAKSDDANNRLSGAFTITKSSIEDNQPYITAAASPTDAERKVSITDISPSGSEKIIGGTGTNKNNLFTFYLPLPAVANPYGEGSHKTTYKLKMHVIGTQGGSPKCFVRTLTVDIRRLSITMMPAMEINTVVDLSTAGTGSVGTPTIVGCGTEARPFQVYTADQLKYLRDCNNNSRTVNGQTLGANTYIKICRSDITLTAPSGKTAGTVLPGRLHPLMATGTKDDPAGTSVEWNGGFSHFKGHMYFSSSAGENGGITNNSGHPLFESIDANAWVEGVYVKGEINLPSGSGTFSPMCGENNGTMKDCHNKCRVSSTSGHNLAGLCCTNKGSIIGGANDALLTTTGNVAGICYTNSSSGTLQGNFSLSTAVPNGANIAGICYSNSGYVQDCQVSANITDIRSSGNWGVVVFENSNVVTNCRSTGTVVFSTSGSIGGVVNTNNAGGTIDGCSLNVTLRGGDGSVGGIVAVMNGGTVRNCYANGEPTISGRPSGGSSNYADYAGGIVGWLHGGAVYNCYNRCMVSNATNSGTMLGRIDHGATIENCWSDQAHDFLGDVSSRSDQGEIGPFCFSAHAGDTSRNCVLILTNWYRIMVPWNLKHKVDVAVQAAGSSDLTGTMARFQALVSNYYVASYYGNDATPPSPSSQSPTDKYLCDALKYWVTEYQPSLCRQWTTTTGQASDIYPVFVDPQNTKLHRHKKYSKKR